MDSLCHSWRLARTILLLLPFALLLFIGVHFSSFCQYAATGPGELGPRAHTPARPTWAALRIEHQTCRLGLLLLSVECVG